ncbi:MAG TPA: hypothetical protein VHD62_19000 [Opitutaceae bacterium]|nr:hypothetical protein [Opitutaceae bacterium]
MLLNSWPVRFLIRRAARAYGFLDPVNLVAKIRGFAQPSEFSEPIELLRAGMLFHARGLVNTKAIQNNLDWVWPHWVERQFNPADESFIPRAFSFSHINLTHRNWTAVGLPDVPYYPIVDPRGLVTPLFDGWSLDFWLVPEKGVPLVPAKLDDFSQQLELPDGERDELRVRSVARWPGASLVTTVALCLHNHEPHCCIEARASGLSAGFLAVSLRPYNPEGISFIDRVAIAEDGGAWLVNGRNHVLFDRTPTRHVLSVYQEGDAAHRLHEATDATAEKTVRCAVGMATAVALFPLGREAAVEVRVPINDELEPKKRVSIGAAPSWRSALAPLARLRIGDAGLQRLYDLAVANLVLHAPDEVYPGPYTYKRFWFRDAAFILHAILALGDIERTRRALRHFAPRQRHDGYFLSQEGEWDANGEAIWMYHRFAALTGEELPDEWLRAIEKGARWIGRKRLRRDSGLPEAGLLPAGFSAEHLGPNDFYYWDDFWGVAGLRCAAELLRERAPRLAGACGREAEEFLATIERSFPHGPQRRFPGAIPASPKRRMDSGAVGSLVADYPLQLFAAGDERILKTADYLRDHSSFGGGFFQNMIHSGINAYLTLHLAQIRLRAGQAEAAWEALEHVAALASPTGQWPEAIHPRTGGGCMGDGEHMWAAAEWVLMLRACFVREERDALVIASGVRPEWWREHGASFGPTLTRWGAVTVHVAAHTGDVRVEGDWRGAAPRLEVRLPPPDRATGTPRAPVDELQNTGRTRR